MASLDALTGRLVLHVGAGHGAAAITGSRPAWAERLAPGRPADALPALLASVYTLCSHAQRLTSQAAVDAARGLTASPDTHGPALRLATLREQVLRICHDWPRRWGLPHEDAPLALRGCPLWRDGLADDERLALLPDWLAHKWLGEPAADWLARHAADPGWAPHWAMQRRSASPVARLLARLLADAPAALSMTLPGATLDLPGEPASWQRLASAMAGDADFCARPLWQGRPASTGPWSRGHGTPAAEAATPWQLLLSRVTDVLHLVGPGGERWLARGAVPLAPHEGLGWCETARGLLVHWVRLAADDQQVQACRVLAPTEWNFHPHGALAGALGSLDTSDTAVARRAATVLAMAFDPCVDFDILLPGMPDTAAVTAPLPTSETQHA